MRTVHQLNLRNLNNRAYVHGTSIVKGLVDFLSAEAMQITDFNIRLRKKLLTQPEVILTDVEESHPTAAAVGSFTATTKMFFYMLPTNIPVNEKDIVDEKCLSDRVIESATEWNMQVHPGDDMHLCFNEVSKLSNQILFAEQLPMDVSKQTWFVGYSLNDLSFLSNPIATIGISKEYTMLTPICMKRTMTVDGTVIGSRVCIYS